MRSAFILVAGGVLAGCANVPPGPILANASDPTVATRPVTYRPVVDSYIPRRPADPEDWRERNRQVGPEGGDQ
jgi:hypothetical protein